MTRRKDHGVDMVSVTKIAGTFARVEPQLLAELLSYDPLTGLFTWRTRPLSLFQAVGRRSALHTCQQWNARHAGKPALTSERSGYLRGEIFGKAYSAHECAWAITHGEWPFEIDHINGDRSDNRLSNLRVVDRTANAANRKPRPKMTPEAARERANEVRRARIAAETLQQRAERLRKNAAYMRNFNKRNRPDPR